MRSFFRGSRSRADDATALVDTDEGQYHVGERWHYRTRAGEEGSLLTVSKVESSPSGVIVHVRVDGVRIEDPHIPGGVQETLPHMPFAEAAIDESVTARAAAGPSVTADEEGYREWRRAYDAGTGGIFTIPVASAVEFVAQAMREQVVPSRETPARSRTKR